MTWIRTDDPRTNPALAQALGEGLAGYPAEYDPSTKASRQVPKECLEDDIVLAHSLIPEALRHTFAAYRAVLSPSLPLSRAQHEMIATVVSAINTCFY